MLLAQVGAVGGLGQLLIIIIVLCGLWAGLVVLSRYFSLPPLVMQLAGIIVAVIVAMIFVKILFSLL